MRIVFSPQGSLFRDQIETAEVYHAVAIRARLLLPKLGKTLVSRGFSRADKTASQIGLPGDHSTAAWFFNIFSSFFKATDRAKLVVWL